MSRYRLGSLCAAVSGLVLLGACRDEIAEPTHPVMPKQIQAYVTGDAAQSLGANGEFSFAPASPPTDLPIISAERAGELAAAYVRTYGSAMRSGFQLYGAPDIDLDKLHISPRIFYAETPHARVPDVPNPGPRRHYGPYYITHLLVEGRPALTVAVSAYAHDVGISPEGRIARPVNVSSLFFHFPVTDAGARISYSPLSPEEAVALVASRTGAKVTSPPRLLLRDRRFHPVTAQWQLTLDRAVGVQRAQGGGRAEVRELFVGPNGTLSIPSLVQPAATRVMYRSGPRPNRPGPSRSTQGMGVAPRSSLDLPRRPDLPAEFDDVVLVRAEG